VGNRHKRLGLNLLGTYDMVSQESPNLVSDRH